MTTRYEEEDLRKVKPVSIDERDSKVHVESFVDPEAAGDNGSAGLIDIFPPILKGADLKDLVDALRRARDTKKQIVWLIGAHVIKCGLSLYMKSLIERGYITAVATTGSATVHDLELAFYGKTSEDVAAELPAGRFGMSKETAAHFEAACDHGSESALGLGEAVGDYIVESRAPYEKYSLFAAAARNNIPATVHVALGTDITHQHPGFPSAKVGELSMRDFRIMSATVGKLFDNGVVLVFGSAVVLPEVFLKAVSISYNLGRKPSGVTAANFDMLPQYRVKENVLTRPFKNAGKSYAFHGHHEIMLPLLHTLLIQE